MCVNSPDHHAVQYGDLERVDRGLYRMAAAGSDTTVPQLRRPAPVVDAAVATAPAHDEAWFWEGNVQAAVVSHLALPGGRSAVSRTRRRVSTVWTSKPIGRTSG
jgi:hypothetical protein